VSVRRRRKAAVEDGRSLSGILRGGAQGVFVALNAGTKIVDFRKI
jgi:hypothetical protein